MGTESAHWPKPKVEISWVCFILPSCTCSRSHAERVGGGEGVGRVMGGFQAMRKQASYAPATMCGINCVIYNIISFKI